jgi:hypothetical protein
LLTPGLLDSGRSAPKSAVADLGTMLPISGEPEIGGLAPE